MTYQNNSNKGSTKDTGNTKGVRNTNSQDWSKGFRANEIKSLIHNQGKANWGGQIWLLKNPSWNDATLQSVISDPKFTAVPQGKPAADGKWTYELCGHGKSIKVTLGWNAK